MTTRSPASRTRRRIAPALAALTLSGAMAGSALAVTPSPWRGPDNLSPQGSTIQFPPELEAAETGSAIAVWSQGAGDQATVRVARRDLGGPWRTATNLSAPGVAIEPVADIDDQDDAVVAWIGGADRRVQVAVRPGNTGDWIPAVELGAPEAATDVDVVVAPSGEMTAIWRAASGTVRAATRPAGTGAWSAPQDLGTAPGDGTVSLAVAADGTVMAAWGGGSGPKQTAVRPPGGAFGAPETLPDGGLLASLHIALEPDGDAVALEVGGSGIDPVVQAAGRPAGGTWSAFQRISAAGATGVANGDLATDGQGNAVAVWLERDASGGTVMAAERPAGGAWSAPEEVTKPEATGDVVDVPDASSPALALGTSGVATVTWLERGPGEDLVRASRRRSPGAAWGAPESAGRGADIPPTVTVAASGDARAVALWELSGVLRAADRQSDEPGDVRLTAAQLLTNQRISQAAVRRTNAARAVLAGGIGSDRLRDGGLPRRVFGPSVAVTGAETGAIVPPGAAVPVDVPDPTRTGTGGVTLSRAQLLINQRVSQAAVRRANQLLTALGGNLSGGDVRDGSVTAADVAPGLGVAAAGAPSSAPAPFDLTPPTRSPGGSGQVTLSAAQLLVNQRISQAAVIRANAVLQRLERGLPGTAFRGQSVTSLDLQ